jgi:hypothetical protein
VAAPPDQLSLLDHDPPAAQQPSRTETPSRPSQAKTTSGPSHPETRRGNDRLQVVVDAATMVEQADRQLDAAISAARADGCSWREIGIAAGVPYQTLHRRYRKEERDDVTP